MSQALGGGLGLEIDEACFNKELAGDPAVDEDVLATLTSSDGGWPSVNVPAREALLGAYFACKPDLNLPMVLYLGLVKGPLGDDLSCVLTPLKEMITTEMVASSLSVTAAMDDLPPGVTADVAAALVPCFDDVAWWIDDVEMRLGDTTDLPPAQARCVAEAIVESKGIEFVVDRRLATVPVWVMSPADQAALDLTGRCGVDTLEQPRAPLHATRGGCANLAVNPFGRTTLVPCDGAHSGEVLAAFPMGDESSPWPGYRSLVDEGNRRCADTGLLARMPEDDGWIWAWDAPTRNGWEAGDRDLTCLIGKANLETWEGPSGFAA